MTVLNNRGLRALRLPEDTIYTGCNYTACNRFGIRLLRVIRRPRPAVPDILRSPGSSSPVHQKSKPVQ